MHLRLKQFGREEKLRMYKLALLGVLLGMLFLMWRTIVSANGVSVADSGMKAAAFRTHRLYAWWLFGTTLAFILLIEGKRMYCGGIQRDWLFFTHVPFAVLFLLVMAQIVFRFNGQRSPMHPLLGYLCAGLFVPTVLTGVPMILRMKA